jgi:Xaa-Pro aminopeptidase
MEFSVGEMTRRLDTVRSRMAAAGVDCMLITGTENFSYFVGVPISLYQSRRPWAALIPVEADPVAIMRGPESGPLAITLRQNGFFPTVEGYPFPVSTELPRRIADLVKRFKTKRLACELGLEMRLGLPLADFNTLLGLLPGVEIVDAADIIWSLRMTKSPEEVARMRRACEITGNSRQEVFRQVRRGMTEGDVADLWADLMHKAGAERPSFIYINTGPIPDLLPSRTKTLQPGETLWLDGGVYVGGYTCDFSRVATLGPPSPRQIQLHRDTVEVVSLIFEKIRPGAVLADLARLVTQEMQRRGYVSKSSTHGGIAGHGMGQLINEPPLIAPWNEMVISEGLLLGVELGPVQPEGMFTWEHLVHVTRTGYDLLTTEPSTLVVIEDF